jgi:AraC-like DNA-binding protein
MTNAMVDDSPRQLRFTTDALIERDRFPAFCEDIVRRHTALDMRLRTFDRPFRGSVELHCVGALRIGLVGITPVDTIRSEALARDGDDELIISLLLSGSAYQSQLGEERTIVPDEGVVCDCGRPGFFNFLADTRFWTIKIPRVMVTRALPRVDRFAGAKLDRDPVARRLLSVYLRSALAVDFNDSKRAIALYDQHIVDLIALALGAEGDARALAQGGGGREARRIAVLREIEQRLQDPSLSAAAVAVSLGVTPRYVHILLEETGCSFMEHVLEQRLEKIAESLRDPLQGDRRITDIAFAAGFTDLSHFNRRFRRRYGETPSQMRAAARRSAAD